MWRLCPRSGLWRRGCQHGEAGWHLSAFWNHSRKSSALVCLSIASKPTSTERTVPWVGWQNGRELSELDGSVHRLSPVGFSPVSVPELALPDRVSSTSAATSSCCTYQLARAVQVSTIAPKEACKKIGPLNHAKCCCSPHRADWQVKPPHLLITEPPMPVDLSDNALLEVVLTPLQVDPYPVHTVAVKLAAKAITETATAVVGEEQRHGFICSRLHHCKQLPTVISNRS